MTKKTGKNIGGIRRARRQAVGRKSPSLRGFSHLARVQRLTRTGSWILSIPSGRSFWSGEFCQIFAFDIKTKKPALSALLERVHPDDRLDVRNRIDRAVLENRGGEHGYRLLCPDGQVKHIHAVLDPVADKSGKVYELVGTVADITEHVKAGTELRRSEAYLAEAQKISHTGCWARNPTTGELYWSEEEWRIFGLDPKKTKLSYDLFLQMIHPEDRRYVEETSKQAVREAKEYDIPFRVVLPDGSIKHIHSVGKPFFEVSGNVTEYIGVSMDVTQRKLDEESLQLAQAELARVARLTTIGELAASIAHEIKQPLAAVNTNSLAALRWLRAEVPNVAEAMDALEGISRDTRRASEVIERIRALLKDQKPTYVRLDVNDVIREVIAVTHGALRARGVSIRMDLSTKLPAVRGDRVQLQQVIMNLIMNGVDAMTLITDRPPVLHLETRIEASGKALVAVDDTGAGVDAGLSNRIFEPLFTTKSHGMGMGLAICKSIVESHGGRIWALPRRPHGTTFQFTVPTAEDTVEESAATLGSARDHR
jgi:PAS domain S-box-containing protein